MCAIDPQAPHGRANGHAVASCNGLAVAGDVGHKDSTTVECDGNIQWSGNKLNGKLYVAGSKLPAARAAQNNDPNYQAADGWFFRPWDRPLAWEFVRFSSGQMIVHHFCTDSGACNKKSPEGSAKYCCGSTSERKPTLCSGTFSQDFPLLLSMRFPKVCLTRTHV